ncbi:hypothetical protein E3E35_09570 [Thermococcus sp. GR7]|uniref:hypothetical protein n=1 Tax=unclassified Thermococcus TaxID=2627626 RepID=UPI001430A428|nr:MULTISPECIES: hypothetical protein [unclassified Thermococcus]NJE47640.1 hypothetical protein [Thermococcus sp. GR7]NJE78946.1 hypothetical protein [Thermococcus sp. GR4]NJF22596.1 hypothetical protein [Thermococcus sp. GR5]
MKITVKPRRGWRRVTFRVPDEALERIEELCERYGFRLDEALRIILLHDYVDDGVDVDEKAFEKLEKEIDALEKELYKLEGKWSSLKFRSYYIALDNQNLGIQLSGMIAENKRLRKVLGKEERDFSEVKELIHYYMAFGDKD